MISVDISNERVKMKQIDYTLMRENTKFVWYVNMSLYTLAEIAGVTLHDLFTDHKAGIKLYGEDNYRKYFDVYDGCEKIRRITPATPPVSYGHLNGLGVPLVFPDGNGEVNYERSGYSLDEWIRILDKPRDYKNEGMAPFYIDYLAKMKEAFPGKQIGFGYGYEGALTTAYTMLDMQLYYDLYDDPEKLKTLLTKVSKSVTDFKKFQCEVLGADYRNTSYMCDDCAALVPPDMWEEFVVPFMDMIYSDVKADRRSLHCEGLTFKHLRHLETLGITWYDPSVSPKLDPVLVTDNCRVPYIWRMCEIYHRLMDRALAKDFVYAAVRDGASGVFTTAASLESQSVDIIKGFIEACETVDKMFGEGYKREDVGKLVSQRGNDVFWEKWRRQYIGG